MGQRLYVIRNDRYRLNVVSIGTDITDAIARGESKFGLDFCIREKLKAPPLETYRATIENGKVGFSLSVKAQFGAYLYTLDLVNIAGELQEHLAFGFIDVMPDV